ncbi:MAG TPA: glycosyl hydrolase family 28 protein [Arachidicoccus soli]|nr:glycosyl hydrolase family 28 protein [Arachidicoccus soli]
MGTSHLIKNKTILKRGLSLLFVSMTTFTLGYGQDYKASFFGCKSDGMTNNTSSIQFAIDYISENGGGKLNFYVGRYLTGGIELKSNVTIELHEGAVLVASPNINDYLLFGNIRALLYGKDVSNVSIIGKGVVEAQPDEYFKLIHQLRSSNILSAEYLDNTPSLLSLVNCKNIKINGVIFQHSLKYAQVYFNCKNVTLDSLTFTKNSLKDGPLIVFHHTTGISLNSIFIETIGEAIVKDQGSSVKEIKNCITSEGKPVL